MVTCLLIRRVYEREPKELCPGGAATPDLGRGRKWRGPYYHENASVLATLEIVTEP